MKRYLLMSLALVAFAGSSVLAQDTPVEKPEPAKKTPAEIAKIAKAKQARQARQIADLVDRLGAEEYKVREQAYEALVKIGPAAVPALEKAKQSKDPEVAAAAAEALTSIRTRHKLPKKKTQTPMRRTIQPKGLQERDFQRLQPMPGQEEMLKQLEGQFPEMRKLLERMRGGQGGGGPQFRLLDPNDPMFKDLFQGRNPFGQLFGGGEKDTKPKPGTRSRSRVWSNFPNRRAGPSGSLGVRFRGATPVLRSQLNLPAGQGLIVHQLRAKSFAKTQGLQQYDILLEVDGKPIRTELDLRGLVAKGGKATVLRKGKRVTLTFAKAPKLKQSQFRPRRVRPLPPNRNRKVPAPKKDDETRDF
ncbi:MAG: PDZ domain-containing protein [Planctomycetes bacterium]|nr:PDZ domain-containing protein [Planctomycetota bacterium]